MSHYFSWRRVANGLMWLAVAAVCTITPIAAQTSGDDVREMQSQVRQYLDASNYEAALPLLEKIVAARPEDAQSHFYLGFATLARSKTLKDAAQRRQARLRARQAFLKAQELGMKDQLLLSVLETLPADGGGEELFSANAEADAAMREGEALYTQGKIKEALAAYQRALEIDPQLYEAALFAGDMEFKLENFEAAETWYQKAIAMKPDRETAYRYSASPLMRQGKLDLARDRYIEAYLAEPYNRLTGTGLSQWAKAAGVRLAHPQISIPTNVSDGPNGQINITLGALDDAAKNDGTSAWTLYGILRAGWRLSKDKNDKSGLSENFRAAYPNETKYRHSLAEEMSALGFVVKSVKDDLAQKKIKNLDPSLARLVKLSDEGLLEAYVLLGRADAGLAQDYAAYRKAHRDKLRLYVTSYILTGGGAN